MIRQHQEKIVFALLIVLAIVLAIITAATSFSSANSDLVVPYDEELKVNVDLPAAAADESLFVDPKLGAYYPGDRDRKETIFGKPRKPKKAFKRNTLDLPTTRRPRAPGMATTPGPALPSSDGLPRTGEKPEKWK